MSDKTAFTILIAWYLVIIIGALAAITGSIMNIYKFVMLVLDHAPVDALWLARLVGIPVPILGAVLGYL